MGDRAWRLAAALAMACALAACGSDDDGAPPPPVAVLSAFPAELAPLLAAAEVRESKSVEGRTFYLGELAGEEVVLAMTGIGLVNAAATTNALLDNFAVSGVVVSGVAGSSLRIGDVTAATSWALEDGSKFDADAKWLEIARAVASSHAAIVDTCTIRAMMPEAGQVCVAHVPAVTVGGSGLSSDSFGPMGFQCRSGTDEVFGCNVPAAPADVATRPAASLDDFAPESITVEDMETAAIAREATRRGVRFVAFRGTSDGSGDPLDLPGFPAQFFAYYRLAARNAAGAAIAFLERLHS